MERSETPAADSVTADAVDLASANPHSLHKAVHARREEYVRRHRIRIKVGTWNVAACPGTDKDLARWFVDGQGLDPALGSANPPKESTTGVPGAGPEPAGNDAPVRLTGDDKIGLYVLGLQEVNHLSAPGQYMTWIYAADTTATDRWKAALQAALPGDYQLVAVEQMAGLLLLAYAAPEVAATISNTSVASVATGALGYLGNKGAVCARIVLGEATRLVFVNCHLASGTTDYYVERRVAQVQQILSSAQFESVTIAGVSEEDKSKIGDEDFAFWFGDLNSRLDRLPGDDIRRLLMLHTRGEYDLSKGDLRREDSLEGEAIVVDVERLSDSSDEVIESNPAVSSLQGQSEDKPTQPPTPDDISFLPDPDEFPPEPSEDPASLQATLDSLLPHDQLRRLIKERKAFHDGWREGPITFLPTYKYDVGSVALFDSSEKRRPPSWCDRILYRTRSGKEEYDRKAREEEESRRKDKEMKARGMEEAGDDDNVLFSYDPDNDGDEQPSASGIEYDEYNDYDEGADEQFCSSEGDDRIRLDLYTSHQRITSSDHKPVSSIFTLDYDAVVPELKAKVHAEVARELDRAENEGRPGITIVVDHHESESHSRHAGSESSGHVDLGEIRFLRKATSSLTLANTGRVPATFTFVEKPTTEDSDDSNIPWLTTSFLGPEVTNDNEEPAALGKEVTLEPGETVNALLEAVVKDTSHARMLNDGQASLEEVLVLRVTDGRDHFIPVRATWAPTCVGRSIEELIRVPEGGIRAFAKSISEKRGRPGPIPYDLPARGPAPKELFRLTEAIETLTQRALAEAQMLDDCAIPTNPGWPFDETVCTSTDADTRTRHVVDILDALDQDQDIGSAFPPEASALVRLEAVAQTLLLFLRGLTDGVVPAPLWLRIEQASIPSVAGNPPAPPDPAARDDRTAILDILQTAPHHNICFVFLTTALARVVAELAPLSKAQLEVIRSSTADTAAAAAAVAAPVRGMGAVLGVGRRSLSFRRGAGNAAVVEALAALERRRVRERKVAGIFGAAGVVCRGEVHGREKERKAMEERQRRVIELFLGVGL
ncbi:PI phosphatase group protein [Madurella fahalii]|uniref:PI phosphatase group protein n=1 Tax=Madurella fahalii TaxID=1157608 RepID=A0ABQ0GAL1_9PEZI